MLTRKARKVGTSMVLSIPSNIVELFGIKEGDLLKISLTDAATITLEKYVELKKEEATELLGNSL